MPSRVCTAVTRGVMGLSRSRRGADALNSNIKVFLAVPVTSSPPFAHARLDGKAISHRISRRAAELLLRLICTSCPGPLMQTRCFLPLPACFFFLSLSFFYSSTYRVVLRVKVSSVVSSRVATEKRSGGKGLGLSHNKSRKEAGRV